MTRRTLPLVALCVLATASLLLPSRAGHADDTVLFSSNVPPNVMLLVDNSGSMANAIYHPAYDPSVTPTCSYYTNSNEYVLSSDVVRDRCGNVRTIYEDPSISDDTIYNGHYLNWYFSDEADPYFKGTANNDADNIDGNANGSRSQCLIDEGLGATYSRFKRSRITAAKEVLREVICQVNQASSVRFGLAKFYTSSDPPGGYVGVPIDDYTTAHGTALETFINSLSPDTWTPLAESLYNVYRYFQSRTLPALGVTGTFPAYNLNTSGGTVAVASAPVTPVQAECQKNFVILITDGIPTKDDFDNMSDFDTLIGDYNPDNTTPEGGNEEVGNTDETAYYLDDVAKFMHENDFQRDFTGDQTIDVYTVGFSTGGAANEILQKTADVANGIFRNSNNAEELSQHIIEQILDILEKSQSFTSATVPASRTTDSESFYSSFFLPKKNTPFWEGHLKSFKFTLSGDILTADDKCAINDDTLDPPCPTSGILLTDANAVWDAADEVPAPIDRKATTGASSLVFGAAAQAFFTNNMGTVTHTQDRTSLGLVAAPDSELAKTPFNLPNPSTDTDLDGLVPKLVSQIAGCEFPTLLGSTCTTRVNSDNNPVLLGDIFHSNPVVIDSPASPFNDASYTAFATQYRQRDRLIYAGANDGWLHAFHAGDWDGTLTPPRHDRGTGTEVLAFMPTEVRTNIWRLPISQPLGSLRSYAGVDGSPSAADVWLYRGVNTGTGQLTSTLLPNATTRVKEQWRTVMIGGLRHGGRSFYALDITDPADSAFPRYLWDFPCQDCAAAINGDGDDAVATGGPTPQQLSGYSWSQPVITRVRVRVDGDLTGYRERWVAVMGGGYDPCGDPNSVSYYQNASGQVCDAADVTKRSRGRAIFIVDITTGKLLAVKGYHTSTLTHNGGQVGDARLKYAFASQPAVFDINFDGFADLIYIGDLGGNMWKWVISAVGDDPINNSTTNNSLGQPDWPFLHFFHGNRSDETFTVPPVGTESDASHYQSFFFPPAAAKSGGDLTLVWGAGEREDTQAGVVDFFTDAHTDPNNNHYYVVKDTLPLDYTGSTATLYDANLTPIAQLDDGTVGCANVGKGYFLTGRDREKFISDSVIFQGEVITGSYVPSEVSAGICAISGSSYLYRFDLECGTGSYPGNPGGPDDQRRKLIGGGLPTRPRVSVGDLNSGGGGGSCENKVLMIASDGPIENGCGGSTPRPIELRSWRER